MNIHKYCVNKNITIIEALNKINTNKKNFLVIINSKNNVIGITTEGDIRRKLLEKKDIYTKIPFNKEFVKINKNDPFLLLFDYFKSEKISHIPILNNKNKLINIISKKKFHVMLLKDIKYDLNNIDNINENELDYELFARPWGFYKSTLLAEFVQSKIITVFPREELSLQKHKKREEHWIIIKGQGQIILENSILTVEEGRYIYIPKGCKHKIINSSKDENLIFAEVQLGEYFGEDDIIRYEDKYGRVINGI